MRSFMSTSRRMPRASTRQSHARARLVRNRFAQRYLKSVRYGNRTPRQPVEDLTLRDDWLFEAVLDYGEHDAAMPTAAEVRPWSVRKDPFSRFRATFEVRTYR